MNSIPDSSLSVQPSSDSVIQSLVDQGIFDLAVDYKTQTFWFSQRQIAELLDLEVSTINEHISNFKSIRIADVNSTIRKSRVVQKEGKRDVEREIEQYNHSVWIYIGYRAQASAKTLQLQRAVEEVFRRHMVTEHDKRVAKLLRIRDGSLQRGTTLPHAIVRAEIDETFSEMTGNIIRMTDKQFIGVIVNTIYQTMFGMNAEALKKLLNTDTVRDVLPELQLEYLKLGEMAMNVMLPGETGDVKDVKNLAVQIFTPLAVQLKQICDFKKIHIVTGKPL